MNRNERRNLEKSLRTSVRSLTSHLVDSLIESEGQAVLAHGEFAGNHFSVCISLHPGITQDLNSLLEEIFSSDLPEGEE